MKRNGYIIKENGEIKAYTDTNDGGCVSVVDMEKWSMSAASIDAISKMDDGFYKVSWKIFKGKYSLNKSKKVNKENELKTLATRAGNNAAFTSSMGGLKNQAQVQMIVRSNQERKIKRAKKYIKIIS